MTGRRTSILFLCTGNSARSIMAEGIARDRYGDRIEAESAGSRPKSRPHPEALATLRRHGVATTGLRSKGWETFRDRAFDLVVTLCSSAARDPCPRLPGAPATVHWDLPDPPAADDPAAAFERVFATLDELIGVVARDGGTAPAAAAEAAWQRRTTAGPGA